MNVHGFGNLNNNQNQNGRNNNYQNLNNNINDSIPLIANLQQSSKPPLEQTVPYTLKLICCPQLKLLSISIILSIIMILLYIICCFEGITMKNQEVLQIQTQTLLNFGAMQDIKLKNGQIHRLITASLLHRNLLHIVMNIISFMFLLSRLQKNYNIKILSSILLSSSISAYILSALCNPPKTVSVGSSTLILGIIGVYVAFLTINWKYLANYRQIRSQICCTTGILLFFAVLFSFGKDIDGYGHLGGIIGGYLMALILLPALGNNKNRIITLIAIIGQSVYLITTFILFYFVI